MANSSAATYSEAIKESSPQESSWTFYILGFICEQNDHDHEKNSTLYSSEYDESPSLVSDAASSSPKKSKKCKCREGVGKSNYKKNSFKKQKTKVVPDAVDWDLEDTASSTENSPKVNRNIFSKDCRNKGIVCTLT